MEFAFGVGDGGEEHGVFGDVETLYISADQLYFATHTLLEVADQFSKMNGKHLFIDEIHKYPEWSRELKEIIDTYSDM